MVVIATVYFNLTNCYLMFYFYCLFFAHGNLFFLMFEALKRWFVFFTLFLCGEFLPEEEKTNAAVIFIFTLNKGLSKLT